jgi:hypothetical protein
MTIPVAAVIAMTDIHFEETGEAEPVAVERLLAVARTTRDIRALVARLLQRRTVARLAKLPPTSVISCARYCGFRVDEPPERKVDREAAPALHELRAGLQLKLRLNVKVPIFLTEATVVRSLFDRFADKCFR